MLPNPETLLWLIPSRTFSESPSYTYAIHDTHDLEMDKEWLSGHCQGNRGQERLASAETD